MGEGEVNYLTRHSLEHYSIDEIHLYNCEGLHSKDEVHSIARRSVVLFAPPLYMFIRTTQTAFCWL